LAFQIVLRPPQPSSALVKRGQCRHGVSRADANRLRALCESKGEMRQEGEHGSKSTNHPSRRDRGYGLLNPIACISMMEPWAGGLLLRVQVGYEADWTAQVPCSRCVSKQIVCQSRATRRSSQAPSRRGNNLPRPHSERALHASAAFHVSQLSSPPQDGTLMSPGVC
jgi:hypothetical protein